ncbi:uncharacterized protein MELLADRAFT_111101 [Melampsora larici-populina 98AG31]|uniref:Uncharacterized protein n=1 Tax=Melampsora larici-populina (strain 98AG31 / pathotype 3-4-7) TaxID=747676 RepID=F4S217_MELLP|nr:uncharacterized protein MELLADRAFT_111101 [Melampsora larici-populina 98AG31]EGG01285.1 hypothetical protein MELLADRAFT_111101 [Melampsora larici-populina 98AG31]
MTQTPGSFIDQSDRSDGSLTDDVAERSLDPRPDPHQASATPSRSFQRTGNLSADGKTIFRPSSETSEDILEDENDSYVEAFLEYSKTEEFQTDFDGPVISTSVHYWQHVEVTTNHQDLGDQNTTNEFDSLLVDPAIEQLAEPYTSVTQITQQTPIVIDDNDVNMDYLSRGTNPTTTIPESHLDHMRSVADNQDPDAVITTLGTWPL